MARRNLETFEGKKLKAGINATDAADWLKARRDAANQLGFFGGGIIPPTPAQQKALQQASDNIGNSIRAHKADRSDANDDIFADASDLAWYAQSDAEKQAEEIAAKTKANADKLAGQAKDFRTDLPNYVNKQIDPLADQSRRNLVNDIQSVKENASRRGLLYSGINEGNQASVRGQESSQLAKGIQDINRSANEQADFRDQLAATAQTGAEGQELQLAQYKATAAQTAYQQALQKQAAHNSFLGDLFGSVLSAGAIIASGGLAAPAVAGAKAISGGIPV